MNTRFDEPVRLAIDQDGPVECIVNAVDQMIGGAYWGLMINLGHSAPYNPQEASDFGRELLAAALERIRMERHDPVQP